MTRRSSNRGFASMDPERRRQLASEGGSSRSGRGRSDDYDRYEDDDDDYESTGYGNNDWEDDDDDYESGSGRGRSYGSRRGFAAMDPEEQIRISSRGGRARWGEDDDNDYDYDNDYSRGRSNSSRRGNSHRGFASMDPDEQRRIASMGGRARWSEDYDDYNDDYGNRGRSSSRGRGNSRNEGVGNEYGNHYFEEMGRRGGETSRDEYSPEYSSEMGRRVGRGRWDEDDDYDRRGSSNSRSGFGSRSSGRSSGRRGFAAMDPEERRRVAAKGGRASHGGGNGRSSNGRGRSANGRGRSNGRRR